VRPSFLFARTNSSLTIRSGSRAITLHYQIASNGCEPGKSTRISASPFHRSKTKTMSSWFGGFLDGGKDRHYSRSHRSRSSASPSRNDISIFRGFFSRPRQSSTSSYKRRPRDGYIGALIRKIRELFRGLMGYVRRNPAKFFMMILLPLITGGALTKILGTVGIKLPAAFGALGKAAAGGGMGGIGAGGMGLGEVMNIAKMFI
jgi:hypothetical protein